MSFYDISLTSGMRSSLLTLKDTSNKIDRTQERLATGKKVNTPLDNPTNFFVAKSLMNAASDIDQLHTKIGEGINTINATSKGLESISTTLGSMKGIVEAAAAASSSIDKQALSKSFDEIYAQLNSLVRDTTYGGTNLISDNGTDPLTVSTADLTIPLNSQGSAEYVVAGKFMGAGYVMHETPGGQPAWVPDDRGEYITGYGTTSGNSVGNLSDVALVIRSNPQVNTLGDLNGDGLLQEGEGTEIDFRLTNTGTATAVGVAFSNATISSGWNFAFNTGSVLGDVASGNTVITDMGSDLDLNIPAGTNGMQFSISLDFTSDGVTKAMTFGPLTVGNITNGQVLTSNLIHPPLANPTIQTDSLKVDPADYEHGIFGVNFPGTPVEFKTMYAEKQGLPIYHSWVYNHFQDQAGIDAAKSDLENAISIVRNYAAAIGTSTGAVVIRSEFNDYIANVFRTGAENLTLADMNEEAANLLMLQTRQQLGITSLSLASQAAQGVLKIMT